VQCVCAYVRTCALSRARARVCVGGGGGLGLCMASITLIPNNFLIPHQGNVHGVK